MFGFHTYACIADRKLKFDLIIFRFAYANGNNDLSLVGEFGGIVAEVHQHLPQPQWIANQGHWRFRVNIEDKLEPFFLGLQSD